MMTMPKADNTNTVEIKDDQLWIYCNRSVFSGELIAEMQEQGLVLKQFGDEFFVITHRNKQSDDLWLQLAEYVEKKINAK